MYLCHHGVKGQKWGIRRYQNADGSLTAEGRKRLAKEGTREFSKNTHVDAGEALIYSNKKLRKSFNGFLRKANEQGYFDEALLKQYKPKFQMRVAQILGEYGDKKINGKVADDLLRRASNAFIEGYGYYPVDYKKVAR